LVRQTNRQVSPSDQQWLAVWQPNLLHSDLQPGDQLVLRRQLAPRGRIVNQAGEEFVVERPAYQISLDKAQLTDDAAAQLAQLLARVLRLDPAVLADQVAAASADAVVPVQILRAADLGKFAIPRDQPGLLVQGTTLPLAPDRLFARPLLGEAGLADQATAQASDGQVQVGEVVGLSGLQNVYDAQLRGRAGLRVDRVDAQGNIADNPLFEAPAEAGEDVVITLDLAHQTAAEAAVATVLDQPSAVVAIRPSTGGVLAAASGLGADSHSTATLGQLPAGAPWLLVGALALLRTGWEPETPIECPASWRIGERRLANPAGMVASAVGKTTLAEALAAGCLTALATVAQNLGENDLRQAATDLGLLGPWPTLGAPNAAASLPNKLSGNRLALALVGQGKVKVSPLAVAVMAASLAAGQAVSPRLVASPTTAANQMVNPSDDAANISPAAPASDSNTVNRAESAKQPALSGDEATALSYIMSLSSTSGTASLLQLPTGALAFTGAGDQPGRDDWLIVTVGDLAVVSYAPGQASRVAKTYLDQVVGSD
jgi:cell division protein FtsI/penicillin-binding protein 2